MEKIKYSQARLLTKICVNSTKTFQTQTGWASFLDEDPNMAYNNFIDEYSRAGGGGEETSSGTEKRCSHNLQSGHQAWCSAENYSILHTVNIFTLFRSKN